MSKILNCFENQDLTVSKGENMNSNTNETNLNNENLTVNKGENMKETNENISITTTLIKEGYEAKVIYEALKRAGNNPHLKGHIHEILFKDGINLNPINILTGKTAQLVQNPNAKTVDLIVKEGGKIIERIQLKDTPNSINKVIKTIKSGQYNSVKIVATEETAKKLTEKAAKEGINKTIQSSNISTNKTTLLAQKAGAKGSGTLLDAVGNSAKSGAQFGGAISAGVAVVSGISDLIDGKKDVGEVVGNVVVEGAKGAITGAVSSAAATAAGSAIASSVAATALGGTVIGSAVVVAAPVVIAVGVAAAIGSFFSSIFD